MPPVATTAATVDITSDNCYHVVTGSSTYSGTVLDGFTIKEGNANEPPPGSFGGGMYNYYGSPVVSNCTFSSNTASWSGGGMGNLDSNPTISNCTFSSNTATYYGGGMYNNTFSSTVSNCIFRSNTANEKGGGMYNQYGSPKIRGCIFIDNTSSQDGGGIYFNSSTEDALVRKCTFYGNEAEDNGGAVYNGGIDTKFTNSVICRNSADHGGAIYNSGSDTTVKGCTFYKNPASGTGGAICNNSGSTNVCDSILWDDTAPSGPEIHVVGGTVTVTYSDVQGGWTGTGNISADPKFVDPNGEDDTDNTLDDNFRLHPGSPCIDAGNNNCYYTPLDDRDGNKRLIDDYSTDDTGNGNAPIVDMGAYEFQDPLRPYFVKTDYRGFLGIGTFPKSQLHIGDKKGITFKDGGNMAQSWNAYYDSGVYKYLDNDFATQLYSDYNHDRLEFRVASTGTKDSNIDWTNSMTLKSNGSVGFSTTNPRERLQIGGDKGAAFHDGGDKALSWNAYFDNGWKYIGSDFAGQLYMDYTNDRFYLQVAPAGQADGTIDWIKFLTLQADGKMGIGTANPQAMLQIGSGKGLTVDAANDKALSWNAYYDSGWKYLETDYASQFYTDYNNDRLEFRVASTGAKDSNINWKNSMTLKSNGNVGVFTTNPRERLQIGGDKGATFHDGGDKALSWNAYYDDNNWKYIGSDFAGQLYMDYAQDRFYLQVAPAGQADGTIDWIKFLTLQADGKMGIGTADPQAMLQIGSGKGLTIHAATDKALSWNAYYDSGWKYLDTDYAYQLYVDSTADKLSVRTAASGQKDNAITWIDCLTYLANGNVAIGTTDPQGYKLAVAGDMIAESLVVKPQEEWPDTVFQADHQLLPIAEVEKYIGENKRLPGIPSAEEVALKGVNVGEMQAKLLQKIEELTLYMIELKKENESLKKRLSEVEKEYKK